MTRLSKHPWPRVGLAALGVLGIAACNTVLGIEEAELDRETSASTQCDWPDYRPRRDCPLCDETCTRTCKVQECLDGDGQCRSALLDYRKCVGDACIDRSGACSGCTAVNPEADAVRRCIETRCGGCNLTGAASLCESYCSCMQNRCADRIPGASIDACIEACKDGSSAIADPFAAFVTAPAAHAVTCYWEHCERAVPTSRFHCDHAIGEDKELLGCTVPREPTTSGVDCAQGKGYGNAPCNTDDECCATCRLDVGVCAAP